MSERTDKELAIITTLKRHEYEKSALKEAENQILQRNINIYDFVSEDEIEQYQKSLTTNESSAPLTIAEKILAFISSWVLYYAIRYIIYFVTEIPLDLLSFVSFPLTVLVQVYIFRILKNKGYIKRAADFKNWVLNSYIVMAGLFVLIKILIWVLVLMT